MADDDFDDDYKSDEGYGAQFDDPDEDEDLDDLDDYGDRDDEEDEDE